MTLSSSPLLLVTLVASASFCPDPGLPTYELGAVESRCAPGKQEGTSSCSISAEVTTKFPTETLAVLAVNEGDRDVLQAVVPVDRGRGSFRRADLSVPSSTPRLEVKLVGFVVEPVGVTLTLSELSTTCSDPSRAPAGRTACRTVGRVEASDGGKWLSVVEVRPGGDERHWTLVRLAAGRAEFAIEWRGPAPDARSGVEPEVVAIGIVAKAPAR